MVVSWCSVLKSCATMCCLFVCVQAKGEFDPEWNDNNNNKPKGPKPW